MEPCPSSVKTRVVRVGREIKREMREYRNRGVSVCLLRIDEAKANIKLISAYLNVGVMKDYKLRDLHAS